MQQPVRHENEEWKLRRESGDDHEPVAAGPVGFSWRPFVFCDQCSRTIWLRSAGVRFRGAVGELLQILGSLFHKKERDDSGENGPSGDDFPAKAPIAAAGAQQL